MLETGLFKVVEVSTGKDAKASDYLGEKWAETSGDEGAEWAISMYGDLLLLDGQGTVFRPPYNKFRIVKGTGEECGWSRVIYEGDHIVYEKQTGDFIHGIVRYGKYFVGGDYISLHLGWYIEWDDSSLDKELGRWMLDTSLKLTFIPANRYDDFKPFIKASENMKEGRNAGSFKNDSVPGLKESQFDLNEGYIDVPTEEEITNIFYREAAETDPDIAQLFDIKDKYRPGDRKSREMLFCLMDKKKQSSNISAAETFMDVLDYLFEDALEIKAEYRERRNQVSRVFGIQTW